MDEFKGMEIDREELERYFEIAGLNTLHDVMLSDDDEKRFRELVQRKINKLEESLEYLKNKGKN